MKRLLRLSATSITTLMVTLFALSTSAFAVPTIGKPAPNFSATDATGKSHQLSDYKGKYVVLEWTNHECPFTVKHYKSGNMQALQKTYTDKDVVWLSVISSAKGKQGYVSPQQAQELSSSRNAHPSAVLLDESGQLGHLYGAQTTPHMYIITPEGGLPVDMQWHQVVWVTLFSLALCLLASWYPAQRATKVQPAKVLQRES